MGLNRIHLWSGLILGAWALALCPTNPPAAFGAEPASPDRALTPPPEVAPRPLVLRSPRDWTIEETALDALGRIGQPAVPALVRALRDPDPAMRERAALVLARIGPEAKQAVPELVATLDDPQERVQKAAIRALGQIGSPAAPAVEPLMKRLRGAPSKAPNPGS